MQRKVNLKSLKNLGDAWNMYLIAFILLRIVITRWSGLDEENRKPWYCGWTDNGRIGIERSNRRNTIKKPS